MFNWVKGRQNTGYEKLKIFQFRIPRILSGIAMDCYILRYNVGDFIPEHTDPVPGYRHFRLNIELKRPKSGGKFCYKTYHDSTLFHHGLRLKALDGRVWFFRSDIIPHWITEILEGQRIVLTFGIAI